MGRATLCGHGSGIHGTAGCGKVGEVDEKKGGGCWGEVDTELIVNAHHKPWEARMDGGGWAKGLEKIMGKEHIRVDVRYQRPGSR